MVSAATGAMLLSHVAAGTDRQTMLYGCYAMFGLSLVASLNIIAMIWSRLTLYGTSGSARVPTLWIVLGPLGQSVTAAGLLGAAAALAVDHDTADIMNAFAILYGVPVWGFAVLWIALATALTVHTLRRGMPFALTWWSLTFPVGTFVTGTTQLAAHTHLPAFKVAAAIAYAGLLFTWLLVAVRTARGSCARKPDEGAAEHRTDQGQQKSGGLSHYEQMLGLWAESRARRAGRDGAIPRGADQTR